MAGPYFRRIDKPTGKVQIAPRVPPGALERETIPTTGIPALMLTAEGEWVPLQGTADGAVIVMTDTVSGTPYFDDAQQLITAGIDQVLIEKTVPVGVTRSVMNVVVVARCYGAWTVDLDGAIIGAGRTGPGAGFGMPFTPARPMQAGQTYRVTFTSRLNAPEQSVECFLQAIDNASS